MKRLAIIALVTILHVLLLIWFLNAKSERGDPSTPPVPPGPGHGEIQNPDHAVPPPTPVSATIPPLDKLALAKPGQPVPADLLAETKDCTAGILIDWTNKRILWEKRGGEPVPIASMAKMMTVLLLMQALESDPGIELDTPVKVTPSASAVGARQVYLDPRETFTIDELLKCVMVFSANDAAYLLGEFLAEGHIDAFIRKMNQTAGALGMQKAHFTTPHGLSVGGDSAGADKASPLELAYLAGRLLEYPQVLKWSSTRLSWIRENDDRFEPFQLVTTNELITSFPGVNGMKTGYTKEAGYCVTATCKQRDRTMIAVVTGCKTATQRNKLVEDLLYWGYLQ